MTTKPKTRKAPAANAAPKAAPKEAAAEPRGEVSEIRVLVARWRWLAADMVYKAAIAPTTKENEAAYEIHTDEQEKIEEKLANLGPENFSGACKLLEFATDLSEPGMDRGDGAIVSMLKNIQEGLCTVQRDEDAAAREELKAERVEGRDHCRQIFTTADIIMEDRRRANSEALP